MCGLYFYSLLGLPRLSAGKFRTYTETFPLNFGYELSIHLPGGVLLPVYLSLASEHGIPSVKRESYTHLQSTEQEGKKERNERGF
jgi:hypothetical protein